MKKYALLVFFITSSVFASTGGGNVGVCFDHRNIVKNIRENGNRISATDIKHITSITALDLLEARSKYLDENPDTNLILSDKNESYSDYVSRIAGRFRSTLPQITDSLEKHFDKIESGDKRYYNDGIDQIQDVGVAYYLDPEECVIATVIRQSHEGLNGFITKLEFDKRLFLHPSHSIESRNLLMLHETVLGWSLAIKSVKDSRDIRNLVSLLIQRSLYSESFLAGLVNYQFVAVSPDVFDESTDRYFHESSCRFYWEGRNWTTVTSKGCPSRYILINSHVPGTREIQAKHLYLEFIGDVIINE